MPERTDHKLKLLIEPESISRRVAQLGAQISQEMSPPVLLLGVLKGAFIFMADLARSVTLPQRIEFMRISTYGNQDVSSGQVELLMPLKESLAGKNILLVEDIVDTGLTMLWLKNWLLSQKLGQLKLCAFIDKPQRRQADLRVDYVGFEISGGFLVGYGLDFAQEYRQLPGVYELLAHPLLNKGGDS